MSNDYREGFESAQREIASDGWTVATARRYLATVKPLDDGKPSQGVRRWPPGGVGRVRRRGKQMTIDLACVLSEDEISEAILDTIEDIHDELGPTHTVDSATIRAAAVARLFGEAAA